MIALYDSVLDACTVTPSTERGGFPATNVQHIHLVKTWRSLDLSLGTLLFDAGVGATVSFDTVILRYHNLTSSAVVTVQANAIDDWSAPPVSEVMVYGSELMILYLAALATYRFVRITISDATNTNGFLEVGRIMAVTKVTIDGVGKEHVTDTYDDNTDTTESQSRQTFSDLGITAVVYEVNFTHINAATRAKLKALYLAIGQHTPLVLVPDENNVTEFVPIYCRLVTIPRFKAEGASYFSLEALKFTEVF